MSRFSLPIESRILSRVLQDASDCYGDRRFLTAGDRTLSFTEVRDRSIAVGQGMVSYGLEPGDRVALLLPNCLEFVLSWFGSVLGGAAMVPINTEYTGYMLGYILSDSQPRGLVVDHQFLPRLAEVDDGAVASLEWIAVVGANSIDTDWGIGAGGASVVPYSELERFNHGTLRQEDDHHYSDLHSVMYTSGTTGPSKGVMITNGHFFGSAVTFINAVGLGSEDILLSPLPLFHGLASRLGVLPALLTGAEIVLLQRFSASRFWRQVTDYKATVAHTIFTIPPILKRRDPGPYDRSHDLRVMFNAHHDVEFEARFGVQLVEAYGQTESGLVIYSDYPERQEGSCGRPHEDWEVQIVDEFGFPLPARQVGEIVLRPRLPALVMRGYLNKPAATLDAFHDLWLHTGDLAYRDEDGWVYFADRKKDRMRRRGENISSWEVEKLVGAHPDVSECVALPYPAVAGEDDVWIVVVPRRASELSPPALLDWLRSRMPSFMLPRYVQVTKSLPKTPSNKVRRYELIERGLAADAWDRESESNRPSSREGTHR